MSTTLRMREHFESDLLADGDVALRFRITEIEPRLMMGDEVILDFDGVRNMTDSFSNACFAQLFLTHAEHMGVTLKFKSCSPLIRSFILSARATAARVAAAR